MLRRHLIGLAGLPLLAQCDASAATRPDGETVLTVSGLRAGQAFTSAPFDMAMLSKLPQHSFTTRTPWYPQARKFTGPLLRDVLTTAGVSGSLVRAVALNDYWVDIPVDDIFQYGVLLAHLLDDKPLAVRDKGPLFIIYPFDQQADLRNARHYSRCAWQVKAIQVR